MVIPVVTAVTPNTGPTTGGIGVTVYGTGLTGATAVEFGIWSATNINVIDDTQLICVTPEGNPGVVDVTVTTAQGTSQTSVADNFTYIVEANNEEDAGNQFGGSGPGIYTDNVSTEGEFGFEPAVIAGQSGTIPTPEPDISYESALSDIDYLRMIVQEPVPSGMTDQQTLFLDEQLTAILNRSANLMSYAAYVAWSIKAGALLVLTDRNDGLSEKKLSQAAIAAQKQAATWQVIAQQDMKQYGRTLASVGMVFRPYDRGMDDLWNQVWDVSHIDRFWLPWSVIEG